VSTQAWDMLVRRLEVEARGEPRTYRIRVLALAALGYAYIGGILLVAFGGIGAALALAFAGHPLAIKAALPLGVLALLLVRSLPVKLEPPEGIELSEAGARELFRLIEDLRREIGAPRIHRVLVDGALNACVAQIPRLGPLGPARNYLVVGLPLLQALSPDEFRAVVAHELGHVSRRHGRFSAWIYRIRQTWARLLETLEADRHWLFRRFFRWYSPYFSACTFVLAREHEYEADAAAAETAGRGVAASALARLALVDRYLGERYWPAIYAEAEAVASPTGRPFAGLADAFRSAGTADGLARFCRSVQTEETGTADTHPCLSDRLRALGVESSVALRDAQLPAAVSAATRFLGEAHGPLVERFDEEWLDGISDWWAAEHDEVATARARLVELDAAAAEHRLAGDELLERALLVERFRDPDAALPCYRAVLDWEPGNAVALYAIGHALLARGDEAGLRELDAAMAADPDCILSACELAAGFLAECGEREAAERYRSRANAHLDVLHAAGEERRDVGRGDSVRAHDLAAPIVDILAEQLGGFPKVKRAYLARRVLAHLDDEYPSYVLGVEIKIPLRRRTEAASARLVQRLAAELEAPFEFFVVDLAHATRMRRRLRKLAQSEIVRRG
jgi:Zn-dependent protease with chaperone function